MANTLNTVASAYIIPAESAIASRLPEENQDYVREEHDAEGWVLTMRCKNNRGMLFYERIDPGRSNESGHKGHHPVSNGTLDQWSALCAAVPCSMHGCR